MVRFVMTYYALRKVRAHEKGHPVVSICAIDDKYSIKMVVHEEESGNAILMLERLGATLESCWNFSIENGTFVGKYGSLDRITPIVRGKECPTYILLDKMRNGYVALVTGVVNLSQISKAKLVEQQSKCNYSICSNASIDKLGRVRMLGGRTLNTVGGKDSNKKPDNSSKSSIDSLVNDILKGSIKEPRKGLNEKELSVICKGLMKRIKKSELYKDKYVSNAFDYVMRTGNIRIFFKMLDSDEKARDVLINSSTSDLLDDFINKHAITIIEMRNEKLTSSKAK